MLAPAKVPTETEPYLACGRRPSARIDSLGLAVITPPRLLLAHPPSSPGTPWESSCTWVKQAVWRQIGGIRTTTNW